MLKSILGFSRYDTICNYIVSLTKKPRPKVSKMKKLILLLLLLSLKLFAQEKIDNLFTEQSAISNSLEVQTKEFVDKIPSAKLLNIDLTKNSRLLSNQSNYSISIPTKENGTISIELTPFKLTTDDFKVMTPNGEVKVDLPTFYRGKIIGQSKSFVSLTVTKDGIEGMIIADKYNLTIGQIKNTGTNTHIIYSTEDIPNDTPFEEDEVLIRNLDDGTKKQINENRTSTTCTPLVRIYLEADNKMYTDWGSSVTTVVNQMTAIFNEVAILYANESVNIGLSGIFVWTSTDPYATASSTGESLDLLASYWNSLGNSFNGDIVHLVSTKSLGGGIAYTLTGRTPVYGTMTSRAVFASCEKNYAKGLSANITNSVNNVPTYSWNVEVIAHELGHNFGLPHTHSCTWPSGALDDCYATEQGCAAGPTPTDGGTVMSYCHLSGTGIKFINGFGTEPGNKMRAEVAAATCLGSTTPTAPTVVGGGATRDCPGPLTLTASGCSGTYNWYTTSGTGSSVFTGNPYNIPSISASAIYYVTCTEGGCESGKVPVVATVNPLPGAVTVTPATRCDVGSVTLTATGCNYTYNWHTAAVGGSIVGSGNSFVTPSLQATTTYYVNCTDGSCSIAAKIPVTATISTLNSFICNTAGISGTAGNSVFDLGLNNTTGRLMAGNSKSYSTSTASSFPVINYTDNTLTTCQVSAWGRGSSSAILVPFRVSQSGNYQMSTSGEGIVTFSVFSSNTYDCANLVGGNSYGAIGWYNSRFINLSECTTYYALLYNLNNSNSNITLNLVGSGDVLEVVPNSADFTYTYVAINQVTENIEAISASSNFTSLAAGSYRVYGMNYQTGLNTSSLLDQTIAQANALGCVVFSENNKLLTITCPTITPPITTAGSRCGAGTVELSASNCPGGTLNWYSELVNGTSLSTAASYTTPSLSSTTNYYVDCTINGCVSGRSSALATINAIPSAPTVNSPTINSGQTTTLTANGCSGTVNWFDVASGGTSLGVGNSYTTTTLNNPPNATYAYYADCTEGNCTSNRSTATITVTCPIVPPPTTVAGNNCGPGTVELSASNCNGGTLNWYLESTNGTSLATVTSYTTPSLSSTTTYYVDCTINGCVSGRSSVIATINTIPSAPTVNSPTIENGQTALLNSTGCSGTVNWYDVAVDGTILGTGESFTTAVLVNPPNATYLYYSDCTEGNCTSNRSPAIVTVNPNPCPSLSYNLVLPSHDLSSGITKFEAGLEIKAANKVTGNSNVKYDSGKYVLLQAGFVAETGTIFEAYIDGCGNN
ncbi:MAG: hypothetical protein ACJAVW_002308 [Spirosomataceae bacterium]|jgi:hypothetical protein